MTEKTMVEINGINFEVDMRTAVRVDQFKVGDNIKILDKGSKNLMEGVIVDFLNFKDLPTIQVAYYKQDYFGAEIKFLNINSESADYDILPCSPHEFELEKSAVVEKMTAEINTYKEKANQLQNKLDWFLKFYGKHFEKKKEDEEK
ncbi:hypothetical protein Q900_02535 [Listeria monocytogenes]|nr:hypothetical protein [Listeria monocytogenes]EJI8621237.1 hypothetical protein [Listeria monocytogenes]